MSNSSPPEQRPPHLRDDEPIALLIAALSFGAIFFWVLNQNQERFSLGNFLKGTGNSAPQIITTPLPQSTEPEISDVQKDLRLEDSAQLPASTEPEMRDAKKNLPLENPARPPASVVGIVIAPKAPVASLPTPAIAPSPTSQLTPTQPRTPLTFPDVPKGYWAYSFITALSAQGIIGGFPDGTFKPDQPVSRADFATQVQKAYAKPNTLPPIAFTDVPVEDPRAMAIDQAVKANFMSGYPDKTFRPTQKVSRAEAAISMARGLALPIPPDPEAILQAYQDQDQVPSWARSLMAASIQAGLFSGDPDTKQLKPNQSASRSDIAALVFKGQNLGVKD